MAGDRDPEDLTELIATSISRDRLEREKFSVLASLYHKSESEDLARCLQSILEQTMLSAQVVVILDGPVHQNVDKVLDSFSLRWPLVIVLKHLDSCLSLRLLAIGRFRGLKSVYRDDRILQTSTQDLGKDIHL